ncbi:MAG: hypothetical protein ACE5G2_01780 [Candidatus Krumholzibacteriia bacterium]
MHVNRSYGGILCVAILQLAVACQPVTRSHVPRPPQEPKTVSVPPAMGRLIPADAVGFLYLSSVEEIEAWVRGMNEILESEDSTEVDILQPIVEMLEIDPARIDRKKPLGISLSLFDLGQPTPLPTFVLPVEDKQGLLEDLQWRPGIPAPQTSGDYVGIAMPPGYSLGTSTPPVATDLPARQVALRLELDRIVTILHPLLDQVVAAAMAAMAEEAVGECDSSEVPTSYVELSQIALEWAMRVLESSETLDLGLGLRGGQIDVDYALRMTPGSEQSLVSPQRARGLVDLARCLPGDYPVISLVTMDFAKLVDVIEPAYLETMAEAAPHMPPRMRDQYLELLKRGFDLYRQLGGQMLSAAGFGDNGIEMIEAWKVEDAAGFVDATRELMETNLMSGMGIEVQPSWPSEFEGVTIHRYAMKFDFEKLAAFEQGLEGNEDEPPPGEMQEFMSWLFGGDALPDCCGRGRRGRRVASGPGAHGADLELSDPGEWRPASFSRENDRSSRRRPAVLLDAHGAARLAGACRGDAL